MTRRTQPPTHQTTGHPYVDNALRNTWREYRDYLQQHNPYGRYVQLYYGASLIPENIFFDRTKLVEEPPIPWKLKKDLTKRCWLKLSPTTNPTTTHQRECCYDYS